MSRSLQLTESSYEWAINRSRHLLRGLLGTFTSKSEVFIRRFSAQLSEGVISRNAFDEKNADFETRPEDFHEPLLSQSDTDCIFRTHYKQLRPAPDFFQRNHSNIMSLRAAIDSDEKDYSARCVKRAADLKILEV